jgi:hypothetical protein
MVPPAATRNAPGLQGVLEAADGGGKPFLALRASHGRTGMLGAPMSPASRSDTTEAQRR